MAGLPPAAGEAPLALPPHPRLLLNARGVAELKQRIAAAPWAREQWDALKARVDRALADPVDLPPRGGNWSHNYVCPTHGARLSLGKKVGPWQWEHRCPTGPHVLRGDPSKAALDFDGNAISGVHSRNAQEITDAGLLYQVLGEARYARRAREVLLAYAARYLSYPLHDNKGKPGQGGRVASQSLTEASWLIEVCQGADLVWDTLGEAERGRVTDGLLIPALNEIILPRKLGIHNIQCRHNSAIGLVGFLLGDRKLISRAVDDPERGYRKQMEAGVLPDGMWLEGSSGYHFFTMEGVWPLAEAARNCGMDLYGEKLKRMFDAPFAFAMPDFVLPDFNDSSEVPLRERAPLYELGYARYRNPLYATLLAGGERKGRMALLFGVPELPAGSRASLGSRNSTASGYAILQRGAERQATWLCVKYGPHGGGHGHPDKNHALLYARGQVLAPDGGTHAYGSPLHAGWDKATAAHNTLVVDQESQAPAEGRSLAFGTEAGVDFSVTDAGPVYKGVRFVRTAALLTPDLLVLVDQVRADRPRTLDIAYHQFGEWTDLPQGEPWSPPPAPGYRYLKGTATRRTRDGMTLRTRVRPDWQPAVVLAPGEATEVITGTGIRKTTEDRVPMLLFRRTARETAFVWAVSLDGAPVTLRLSPVNDAQGKAVSPDGAALVQAGDGKREWLLLVNPDRQPVTAPLPGGGTWSTGEAFAVRAR